MRAKLVSRRSRGQVLGVALIMGAVILIFALAMVSMLSSTIKLSLKANSGTNATLGGDAVIAKGEEALKQGTNWGSPPSLSFTPIPGYKADIVYTDIPNTQYVVQVNAGNLLNPPGDLAYERTITVDMYTLPTTVTQPTSQPTPWTKPGGTLPQSFSNHRIVQAVVKRGTFNAALDAGGGIATNGNFQVYWGNVYDYYQDPTGCPGAPPCLGYTTITLGNTQPLGPGYPAFHTQFGCIASSGSCGGCFGGSGSTTSSVCLVTDTGAVNPCQLYPNDPNMPPRPKVDLIALRSTAKNIYLPGSGQQGSGCSSGESGYFWDTNCSTCSNTDSIVPSCPGVTVVSSAAENNHQYGPAPGGGAFSNTMTQNVLNRMQQNLGITGTWVGNDDLVFFVDTTDGLPVNSTKSNQCSTVGGASIDFKHFYFKGTYVLLGDFQDNGPGGISIGTVTAPSGMCPATASLSPDFNGFLYISGDITKLNGTPSIYGSVDLEGVFSAKGNVKLYYRSDFNYSQIVSGMLALEQWKEISAFPAVLP